MNLQQEDRQFLQIILAFQNAERFGDSREKEWVIRQNIHILQHLMFQYAKDK